MEHEQRSSASQLLDSDALHGNRYSCRWRKNNTLTTLEDRLLYLAFDSRKRQFKLESMPATADKREKAREVVDILEEISILLVSNISPGKPLIDT